MKAAVFNFNILTFFIQPGNCFLSVRLCKKRKVVIIEAGNKNSISAFKGSDC